MLLLCLIAYQVLLHSNTIENLRELIFLEHVLFTRQKMTHTHRERERDRNRVRDRDTRQTDGDGDRDEFISRNV